jgi:hypothetical protein
LKSTATSRSSITPTTSAAIRIRARRLQGSCLLTTIAPHSANAGTSRSFDPDYPHEDIEFFRDMVEEVFARKAYDPAVIRAGERVALTDPTVAERAKRMSEIKKAAIIGGGVIGGGWAARFLLNGWDVIVSDPDPEAERKVGEVLANARRSLPALSDVNVPKEGRLSFAASIADAVADADWIQESVPERLDIKHKILLRSRSHCRTRRADRFIHFGLQAVRAAARARHGPSRSSSPILSIRSICCR